MIPIGFRGYLGFRGIGRAATFDLVPGSGLTLVVSRDGFGKSSSAEALEQLLTGDTYRWAHRTKEGHDGCRNLHHGKATSRAQFAPEGKRARHAARVSGRAGAAGQMKAATSDFGPRWPADCAGRWREACGSAQQHVPVDLPDCRKLRVCGLLPERRLSRTQ